MRPISAEIVTGENQDGLEAQNGDAHGQNVTDSPKTPRSLFLDRHVNEEKQGYQKSRLEEPQRKDNVDFAEGGFLVSVQ